MKSWLVILAFAAVLGACSEEQPTRTTDPPPDGTELFSSNCAVCHGVQGIGATASAMTDAAVTELTDPQIAAIISGGQNTMPGFPRFSNAEIGAIVDYVRSLDRGG